MIFLNTFHRNKREPKTPPQPLRIEGCKTRLTPEPDDAEIAAQALLEALAEERQDKGKRRRDKAAVTRQHAGPQTAGQNGREGEPPHDAAYYRQLSGRIHAARKVAANRAIRYVAWCEQELKSPHIPLEGESSLTQMETGLYRHLDTIDREDGELKRRWQHCLAEVTVREMKEREKKGKETATQSRHTEKEQHKNP